MKAHVATEGEPVIYDGDTAIILVASATMLMVKECPDGGIVIYTDEQLSIEPRAANMIRIYTKETP